MSDAALIEQPEGSPGAVADAGSSLQRVAGGFERGGGIVARASTTVGAWEGRASVSFDGRAASYGLAMVAVEQALQSARGAVRRYETKLEDARAKIRELREQEDMAVARLERAKGQLKEAQGKLAGARDRMSAVSVSGGLGDPFSMSEQVQAGRDAEAAQADIDAAQKQIDREREEISELRKDAKREETELIEAEDTAAAAVRAAAARLPDVQLPGGAASPSAHAGTPFGGPISPMARNPQWASAMQNAAANEEPDDENGGNLGDFLSGAINETSFGLVDLGGDKDSGAYKGGQGASYIPWNPASALKSAGTGIVKGGAKVLGKEGAEEAAETGVKKSADDLTGAGRQGDRLDDTRGSTAPTHGQTNPYPRLGPGEQWKPSDGMPVLGRLDDTAVAKDWPGHKVLDLKEWSIDKNRGWIKSITDQKGTVYLGSPEAGNVFRAPGKKTVYAQELEQLREAGYRRFGDYMIPPG